MKKCTLLIAVLTSALTLLFAEGTDNPTEYEEAWRLQNQGDFQAATAKWQEVIESAPSALAWYHLALAYAVQEENTEAIHALLQAERYAYLPEMRQLSQKLYAELPNNLLPLPPRKIQEMAGLLHSRFPANGWAGVGFVSLGLGMFFLFWRKPSERNPSVHLISKSRIAASLLIMIAAFIFILIGSQMSRYQELWGVVKVSETPMQTAPGRESEVLMTLPESLPVKLGERLNGYYRADLPNGATGWVNAEALLLVSD